MLTIEQNEFIIQYERERIANLQRECIALARNVDDWKGRVYRANNATVETRDAFGHDTTRRIGAINTSRRDRVVAGALDQLAANESEIVLANANISRAQAEIDAQRPAPVAPVTVSAQSQQDFLAYLLGK